MKQSELIAKIMEGKTMMCGQYLGGRVDTVQVRIKTGNDAGKMRTAYIQREVIITETDAVVVGGFMPDNCAPADFKPAANKGEQVVVTVDKVESVSGFKLFGGQIERLES